jgi:hypothetical protein
VIRINVQSETRTVMLHLDRADRERLLSVLANWLARCAGVARAPVPPADLAWTLELRRLLLSPEEPHFAPLPVTLDPENVKICGPDQGLQQGRMDAWCGCGLPTPTTCDGTVDNLDSRTAPTRRDLRSREVATRSRPQNQRAADKHAVVPEGAAQRCSSMTTCTCFRRCAAWTRSHVLPTASCSAPRDQHRTLSTRSRRIYSDPAGVADRGPV